MHNERSIRRVLITGITGSGGSYLAEYIVREHPHVEVHGLSRWHSTTSDDNLQNIRRSVTLHECDLLDMGSVTLALIASKPDVIFHLASHANVRCSFETPIAVLHNNIMSTTNLFEGIRILRLKPIVQLCSSSEVYGLVREDEIPINEEAAIRPASPYAVSKVTQDLLGQVYFESYGIPVIRTRMFTYINPRRADLFSSAFARQVARIEHGLQDELVHGNLDSIRTVVDVRDAMRAYWEATLHCKPGEAYNIGGTKSVTIGDFLKTLISKAKAPIRTRLDRRLLRPTDVTLQVPETKKFLDATGWEPVYTFDESVSFLLDYWRVRAAREAATKAVSEQELAAVQES